MVAGPAHAVPRARGVRHARVRAQLPGSVALRGADTVRGLLHANRRGHQVPAPCTLHQIFYYIILSRQQGTGFLHPV